MAAELLVDEDEDELELLVEVDAAVVLLDEPLVVLLLTVSAFFVSPLESPGFFEL